MESFKWKLVSFITMREKSNPFSKWTQSQYTPNPERGISAGINKWSCVFQKKDK